jgi:dTDP-4-dehydrorhamnose reductase
MEKMLIIGANGLLGSKAFEIGSSSYKVYGTYSKNHSRDLTQLDATDKAAVSKLIGRVKPDLVLDTHALNNLDYCESHRDLAWEINVDGSRNIAQECQAVGAKYIFISSDYVFDGRKPIYTENDKPNPLNYYGKTKWATEEVLKVLDIDMIAIRTSAIYGAVSSTGKQSFVQWLIESLGKGSRVDIISDMFNSPTLNSDIVYAALRLYGSDSNGIFHVVGGDNISKYEFAMHISEEFDLDSSLINPVKMSQLYKDSIRPKKINLSTVKLKKLTGQVPVGVNEGLRLLHHDIDARKV